MAKSSKSSKIKNNSQKINIKLLRRIKQSPKSIKKILKISNLIMLPQSNLILLKSQDKC